MPDGAVGWYCAVGYRFGLLVSTRTLAARESQAVINQWAATPSTRLGALNLGSVEGWQHETQSGPRDPLRACEKLESRVEQQLRGVQKMSSLVRSFLRCPFCRKYLGLQRNSLNATAPIAKGRPLTGTCDFERQHRSCRSSFGSARSLLGSAGFFGTGFRPLTPNARKRDDGCAHQVLYGAGIRIEPAHCAVKGPKNEGAEHAGIKPSLEASCRSGGI